MLNALLHVIRRDLLLAFRRRTDVMGTLVFFCIVGALFPLGVGPEPELLRTLAPGALWVAALLASTLALTRNASGKYPHSFASRAPSPPIRSQISSSSSSASG